MSVCGRIMSTYMQRPLMANGDRNFGLETISHSDVDSLRSRVTLRHLWDRTYGHPPTQEVTIKLYQKADLYARYLMPSLTVFRTNSVKTGRNEHCSLSDRGSQRVTRKYWFIFVCCLFVCLFWARQPPLGQGQLIHEVSSSHRTTHNSR
jgi:hypothetical protein